MPARFSDVSDTHDAWDCRLHTTLRIVHVSDAATVASPISAALLLSAFDSPLLAAANALKELLPLTDVVPVATLSWLLAYVYPEAQATHLLGLRRMDETAKGEDGWPR